MSIATAVITAPRPRPTLNESLASYRAAGFTGLTYVLMDGAVRAQVNDPAFVVHDGSTRGNLRNWIKALDTLLRANSGAQWFMVCEDDITWARDAHAKLLTSLSVLTASKFYERVGAISLYAPVRVTKELERMTRQRDLNVGWYGMNHGMKTWGAQCLLFSRTQAEALMSSPVLGSYAGSQRWTKNVDAIVAETILQDGKDIAYCIPCLVDHHLGYGNSSLGYPEDRPNLKTRYFADNERASQ